MSNNSPKNTKPAVPPKPTSEQIKAWNEAHKKQTDLITHSQALDIFVTTPSPQVETQKPIIFSKPAPEETKVPEETPKKQSNLTVKEKIEKFFKDHNIDTKDALIPEFSRYIALSGSMAGKRLYVTIKAYEQSLGRLIKQVGVPQKEFVSFIEDDLIKNHPYKDKFEKINQHYKLPEPPKLSDIIDNLRELVNNDDIAAHLKQSRKHIEFKEKINNIIQIYNKYNPATIVKVEAKLKEVGKWCEETTKMDNNPIWKNIGNFIKYSFIGDKAKAAFIKRL
ncbi:hypothetical protein A3305_06810 [Rickettsia amblyommatis]|uniref:Uncharacterized protein n=2 Tax=Rickettsia amblyommatis TaxID=33989 RepID=H8K5V4_RICAG|nr:hypothetical protein [Rickettsia amblyommatis]AFC69898.1 hypothetical protein MCE_05175 [Rickettsia amblyommatis str. GAT-30V]ARD88034.1 hypothetical protein A3305_06810 [Rickettsia amblyommatis]KJV91395.1 hypothetical protein RAMDARK_1065 [Rickettsia amblyommatis str. Darkwater]